MNLKISTSLLALGTFTSAVLLNLTPVSAQTGNGSNIIPPVVVVPGGNGSNTGNNVQFFSPAATAAFATAIAAVNTTLSQILAANPAAVSNATSPAALTPPGASPSLVAAIANLQLTLAALLEALSASSGGESELLVASADLQVLVAQSSQRPVFRGNVTIPKLNAAIAAYNTYVEALVADLGGDGAVAFLSSSGADKALDATNTPGVRALLLELSAKAMAK